MHRTIGLLALTAFGAAAAQNTTSADPAADARDTLRLSRRVAIATALAHNAQLEVAREQTAQARARRWEAIAIPDPALAASFDDQPRLFGAPQARNVGVGLTIPFPDKFRLRGAIATADIRSAESDYRLQRQLIALQTSSTYDSLLVAAQHRRDLQETRVLSADFLKRTQARFEGGTAAKLDVIKAQVDLAQADNDLIANERDVANAVAALNRLMGRIVGAPIVASDSLEIPSPLPDSTNIEQVALANRPELASLASQVRGAHAATGLNWEYWLPDFTLGVSRDYAQPGSPLFTTGLVLPLPAFLWQHTNGEVAESVHRERELSAAYRDLRAQVTQDVRSAFANASTAMRQAVFLRDQLVPAAREAYRVASVSYNLGGASALEVLDARRALIDAEAQLAEALASANSARADLERALGSPIARITGGRP